MSNFHGGINSPQWDQMRLAKARDAQKESENEIDKTNRSKVIRNRIIAGILIAALVAFCVYYLFIANVEVLPV